MVHPTVGANCKRRVRIAILDTGIDQTHPVMKTALGDGRIAGYKGFPEGLDPLVDRHGHGTHGASVLMRTAPYAAIYIARVVDDDGNLSKNDEYCETAKVLLSSRLN